MAPRTHKLTPSLSTPGTGQAIVPLDRGPLGKGSGCLSVMPTTVGSASLALKPSQQRAIPRIRAEAAMHRPASLQTLAHILSMSNIGLLALDKARRTINEHAHIALHFHPDRPVGDTLVALALLRDGVYKNQFETGVSNGLVSVAPGGLRDDWERNLFGSAYHYGTVDASERPKYGALDLTCRPDGPAPRFGSCYFVLKPGVTQRSTFTFGGSQSDPKSRGTVDEFDSVLAAMMEESFTRDFMLGLDDTRSARALECLNSLETPRRCRVADASRNLDHMVEAQVHGDVSLGRDVEALVIDPSFEGREMGQILKAICHKYDFSLQIHGGFRLQVAKVPFDFRGPRMPSLAVRVANGCEYLDAWAIGLAAREVWKDRDGWRDRGSYEDTSGAETALACPGQVRLARYRLPCLGRVFYTLKLILIRHVRYLGLLVVLKGPAGITQTYL